MPSYQPKRCSENGIFISYHMTDTFMHLLVSLHVSYCTSAVDSSDIKTIISHAQFCSGRDIINTSSHFVTNNNEQISSSISIRNSPCPSVASHSRDQSPASLIWCVVFLQLKLIQHLLRHQKYVGQCWTVSRRQFLFDVLWWLHIFFYFFVHGMIIHFK